ncbi:hypothetical protein [Desulfocurvibacter africanus]|nr:hypothetical protein [Desulfocurvibacter africanus]
MSQTELMIIPQSEPQESPYSIALACYIRARYTRAWMILAFQ